MGFPNTIGAIDGMHIKIPQPREHGISYICRKNFPSIILQGICDHKLKFTHCYAGEVGSTHDCMVLRRSEIWNYLQIGNKFPQDTHLLGDKAYPCLPQLITPYKDNGHLNNDQRHFNYLLSSARTTIERAFSLLQKRFRCLKELFDVRCLEWAPKYVIACCVLHNICIMQDDILEIDIIPYDGDNMEVDRVQNVDRERARLGNFKSVT